MATFKIVVSPHRKLDGTRRVTIRVTVKKSHTAISTPWHVSSDQVTRGGRIKDHRILDLCEALIRDWRHVVNDLGPGIDSMTAPELAHYLTSHNNKHSQRIDFVEHMRDVAQTKRASTQHNYIVVSNSLERFLQMRPLDINHLTAQLLASYEQWLRTRGIAPGTIHQYMTLIKSAHNAARFKYNDEDAGVIKVTRTPFAKYKVPAPPAPSARGVDLATLQAIADLPDEERINSRRNFGRDIMMLSFALGGMNYADLYDLPYTALRGDYIEYHRKKTRDSRADGALYRVYICQEVRPLIDRWLDPIRQRLFRFHQWSASAFGQTVAYSVAQVERAVPYERHYIYYAARHTYASLARNIVGIDKYTVHELLNHTDADMRITDRYIERDWQRLFDAHAKVISLLDWSKICAR